MNRKLLVGAVILIAASVSILLVTVEPLRWRAAVMVRFISGNGEDVRLVELARMLKVGTKFWTHPWVEGVGLTFAVQSPFDNKEGVESGQRIFRERCVFCHGAEAGGGTGPSLKQRALFKHGSSDWAMYRTIASGIPGTNMPSLGLQFDEAWQIVSFLKWKSADGVRAPSLAPAKEALPEVLAKFSGQSYDQLLHAGNDGSEWRTYSRTYDGWRFSPLSQINGGNVGRLRLRWVRQLQTAGTKIESEPIVVDGVIFITEPPNNVLALDASSGRLLWTYRHEITEKLSLCCGQVNRGVAVLGDRVYLGTLDARLVALDARTGKPVWTVKVADPKEGYSITGAPLAVGDMVITGVSGSEFAIRGFIQAVDARTGKTRWRFHTIPGPGEPGHDTWKGDAWKSGGGGTWVTGGFDPALDLLYWGVANPSPDFNGDDRPGDNLFTCSVVAIEAKTGRLAWHFQFTPHDLHDWGANQVPVLTSVKVNGADTPVMVMANRNGFYYVLDRRNGRFIAGVPFAKQNWAAGLESSGKPILTPAAKVTVGGMLTQPDVGGATNWHSPAFNPSLGLFYVHAEDNAGVFLKYPVNRGGRQPHTQFLGGGVQTQDYSNSYVRALKVGTGELVWEYQSIKDRRIPRSGLLATAGSLVFGGGGERAFALDAATGKELWSVRMGGDIFQGPISYRDHGEQVILYISGRVVMAFSM